MFLQDAKELCKSDSGGKNTEFLIDSISSVKQAPFNYEKFFTKLLMENKVSSEDLGVIASAIDIDIGEEIEENGTDSAEEMEEDDGDVVPKLNGNEVHNGNKDEEEDVDGDDDEGDSDDSDEIDGTDEKDMDIDDEGIEIHANSDENSVSFLLFLCRFILIRTPYTNILSPGRIHNLAT